ncbi:MAG: GNAT family N-acetyltransferase [Anaeroplasmataceae bacterium]
MIKEVYETNRLKLYLSNPLMVHEVTEYFIRNKEFLRDVEPIRPDEFYTEEYQKKNLLNDFLFTNNVSCFKFWITKKDSEKIIGVLNFNGIILGSFSSCFLSFRLDKDEVRNGYMTEAIKKGIEIAFTDLGLHRIEANIMPNNKPAIDLVSKLGFYNEGLAKKYLKIHGKWEDHIHMVIRNEADE